MTLHHGSKPVDTIWMHQLTTRPEWYADKSVDDMVKEVRRWHVDGRGWRDIGYHYVIDRKGNVGIGRPETMVGAHVAGYNTGGIGIALAGGHGATKTDSFEKNFTEEQDNSARKLIADIKTRANIKRVRGHSEVANKACPGFTVSKWLDGKKTPPLPAKEVKAAMKKSTKYTVNTCGKWVAGTVGGISAGWPAVKEQIGLGKDMFTTFQGLLASHGLIVISGLCIVAAIVFNWQQIKQRDDYAEGRYTPSGAEQ